jgi:alkylated DNA repair dioxygenase AlkB
MIQRPEMQQRDLFDGVEDGGVPSPSQTIPIQGLRYVPAFVTVGLHDELLRQIDAQPWMTVLRRRVQHYGYRYDYKARKVDQSMYLGPLPEWSMPVADCLVREGYMPVIPDQLIVNEYERGQGISPHIDCISCFGPVIASLSLGSSCVMELSPVTGGRKEELFLEPCSLVVLAGEARYNWRHAIPARKSDKVGDRVLPRDRRVSLTFRSVLLGGERT